MKKIIKFTGYLGVVLGTHAVTFVVLVVALLATDRLSVMIQNDFWSNVVTFFLVCVVLLISALALGLVNCICNDVYDRLYGGRR